MNTVGFVKKYIGLLTLVLMLGYPATLSAASDEQIVLVGTPFSMAMSNESRSTHQPVDHSNLIKWQCKIVKKSGKYYWSSNNNTELVLIRRGEVSYFYPVDGGGFIKVYPGQHSGLKEAVGYTEAFGAYSDVNLFWGAAAEYHP